MPNIEIVAGPCAVQSVAQMREVVTWAHDNNINIIRGCLRKPRTHPGEFVGLGVHTALTIVQEALEGSGLTHATEVIEPADVRLMANMLHQTPQLRMINWIGAKTGPSNMIGVIAQTISEEMPKGTELMIKNQMEPNQDAWIGRVEWAQASLGSLVTACHRGFEPDSSLRETQRNQEDLDMTARVKKKTGVKMTLDPSHIAGKSADNVVAVTRKIIDFHNRHLDSTGELLVDRFMLEVSPNPSEAKSDKPQQLPFSLASVLIAEIRQTINMGGCL